MKSIGPLCRCGDFQCGCARWNQIYREKFEDPDYYTRETIRQPQSSLRNSAALAPDLKDASVGIRRAH